MLGAAVLPKYCRQLLSSHRPQIIVGLVGVNAPVPLGQIFLQGQRVDILLHKVTVGVPLAEFANADVDDAEQAAECQHAGQQAAGKDPALLPAPADMQW